MEFPRLRHGHLASALSVRTRFDLRHRLSTPAGMACVLMLVAIAVRALTFGNPIIHIDEQFYRLVGGRMLTGAIPYVDIFDRKPVGLFLIYAALRLPGGDGMFAYQAAALLCAWGTAVAIAVMARRVAPPIGAAAAGALYLIWLDLAGGEGGQAPVFYNLPMALAAAILFPRVPDAAVTGRPLRKSGSVAMLLVGVAMQIKYSAVFEGMYFGCALLLASRRGGRRLPALAVDASLWIAAALLPTAAAAGSYAALGHWPEWLFANVTSILHRGSEMPGTVAGRIRIMALLVAPLLIAIPLRRWLGVCPNSATARAQLRFLDGWAAAAVLGVILFGTWFNHYALPLFAPLAAAAAPLGVRRGGRTYLLLLAVIGAGMGQRILMHHLQTRGNATVLADAVKAAGRFTGCVFVYDGLPAFYDATRSCLLTTRPFPAHLQSLNERGATGIDQAVEVARIMATHPSRVMTMEPAYDEENLVARVALYREIRHGYREVYRYAGGTHQLVLYAAVPDATRH